MHRVQRAGSASRLRRKGHNQLLTAIAIEPDRARDDQFVAGLQPDRPAQPPASLIHDQRMHQLRATHLAGFEALVKLRLMLTRLIGCSA